MAKRIVIEERPARSRQKSAPAVSPRERGFSFDPTQWSLVRAAGGEVSAEARAALASLCQTYWVPLYWFGRRRGYDAEDAQDLTQAFLTS
jgi:RNA polymerase sigma-70 factor (ECF subfamily)